MNRITKFLLLFNLLVSLSGCNDAITRFWNGDGYYPPPAYGKASHECSQAFDKINPPPPQPVDSHSEESRKRTDEFYKFHDQCMKEKGF